LPLAGYPAPVSGCIADDHASEPLSMGL
jgi:hypothetical protein